MCTRVSEHALAFFRMMNELVRSLSEQRGLLAAVIGVAGVAGVLLASRALRERSVTADLCARLAGAWGRAALGAAVSSATRPLRAVLAMPPCPGDSAPSAAWLTRLLVSRDLLGPSARVEALTVEIWAGEAFGGGATGGTRRIRLTYAGNAGPDAPRTLVWKTNGTDLLGRAMAVAGGRAREVLCHQRLKLAAMGVAEQPLWCASGVTGFSLLSREVKGVSLHKYTGAQLKFFEGAGAVAADGPTCAEALREAFLAVARVHSAFWNDPTLLDKPWLKASGWYRGMDRATWENGVRFSRNGWEKLKASHRSGALGFDLSAKLTSVIDASFERSSWHTFQTSITSPFYAFTLTHGDFHAQNISLAPGKSEGHGICMFDWSEVGLGEPLVELGQMMISDVPPEVWRENGKALVREYWEELVHGGVDSETFTFEKCWQLYKIGGVQKWIWLFGIMGLFFPPNTLKFFADQILSFIEDHGDFPSYEIHSSMFFPFPAS